MSDRQTFILVNDVVRDNALKAVANVPQQYVVTIAPRTRSIDQNSKLHAMLTDLAKSDLEWAGKRRTVDEWKVLMISAHAVATDQKGEVIPGIEGEFVAIRESSASMSVARAASLLDYIEAFCVNNGVELRETRARGFMDEAAA